MRKLIELEGFVQKSAIESAVKRANSQKRWKDGRTMLLSSIQLWKQNEVEDLVPVKITVEVGGTHG